jgi:hypothetical protein
VKILGTDLGELAKGLLRPRPRARRYVGNPLSWEDFFHRLAARRIRYVVLRWFETLPAVQEGEDVDLLVMDEDLPRMHDLFSRRRTSLPCDVYSVTGIPGSDYRKMAYFPPHLAEGIISRAHVLKQVYLVPSPPDHFLSLAYHALYHKGYASGLPSRLKPADAGLKVPHHDYQRVLGELARGLSLQVSVDLESLDEHLALQGWRPPLDMLARLSLKNPWIRHRFFRQAFTVDPLRRNVAVFLVRERAVRLGLATDVQAQLEAHGFQVLQVTLLEPEEQKRVALRLRGGNWGRGPWALSGGPPARVIVAWDPSPLPVGGREKSRYPLLENGRILRAKNHIRKHILRGLGRRERFNPLHSSDNDVQAWEYLQVLLPHHIDALSLKVRWLHSPVPR